MLPLLQVALVGGGGGTESVSVSRDASSTEDITGCGAQADFRPVQRTRVLEELEQVSVRYLSKCTRQVGVKLPQGARGGRQAAHQRRLCRVELPLRESNRASAGLNPTQRRRDASSSDRRDELARSAAPIESNAASEKPSERRLSFARPQERRAAGPATASTAETAGEIVVRR